MSTSDERNRLAKILSLRTAFLSWMRGGQKGTIQRRVRVGRKSQIRNRVKRDRVKRLITNRIQHTRLSRGQNHLTGL